MSIEGVPSKSRILVVDDDDDVREGLARALARAGGYDVITAADSFEAGMQFARFQPDVVLLDVVMPGMGGLDVCARMRAMAGGRRLRIIILSGYGGESTKQQSLFVGADMFLSKPQDIQTLLMHIDELLQD